MIKLEAARCAKVVDDLEQEYKRLKPKPLMFFDYMSRVLQEDLQKRPTTYPYTVRIPKENSYLLRGDYTPEKVIEVKEPIPLKEGGPPIWTMSSEERAYIRFGYKNLDPRYVCDLEFSSKLIHGFLGGSSGHGKSVTMNGMINALCYEYPPWELELHLSDAKIAEFKKYGVGHRIPHIASIAATSDSDFVISVLERARDQMLERNKIFGACGCSSLTSFREKMNLVLPRVIILMDEVESSFKSAGRRASYIASLIDDFARLGRSTGYHVFMATQNMTSDIPKTAMNQVLIRASLGANEGTSESILGNKGAAYNVGAIGKLIVNTKVLNGGKTDMYNETYQTPFLTDENFETSMEFLERKGEELGFKRKLAFYDEEDMYTLERFDETCNKAFSRMKANGEIEHSNEPICLGYPAFVTTDTDELFKMWLDHKDAENTLISSVASERVVAHIHNFQRDFSANGYTCLYFGTDYELVKKYCKFELAEECRTAEKGALSSVDSLVLKRSFLLQMDQVSKSASYNREVVESEFKTIGIPSEYWGNHRTCQRYIAYTHLLKDKEWARISAFIPTFKNVIEELEKTNSIVDDIDPKKFAKAAIFIGDLSKITGYGRDGRTQYIAPLKRAMQEACRVNVVFVLSTRSMEGLTELVSAFRYAIFDLPDIRDYSRMKTEEPRELRDNLALIYDSSAVEGKQRKFKRTLLQEA